MLKIGGKEKNGTESIICREKRRNVDIIKCFDVKLFVLIMNNK